MLTIHPQYLTLSKLLDGRLFRVPEYQRAYSWTSRERQDLFGSDFRFGYGTFTHPSSRHALICAGSA